MEDLIIKYLNGDLSLDEQHNLSKWIQSDENNAETLRKMQAYWDYDERNLAKAKADVRNQLNHKIKEDGKWQRKTRAMGSLWSARIAASVTLLAASFLILYHFNGKKEKNTIASGVRLTERISLPGQKITTTLPDGTKVKLNADSKIIVPSVFKGAKREISLTGEAFFEVVEDQERPFIIKTDKLDVTVVGTSFVVRAYSNNLPVVAVKTGKVLVDDKEASDQVSLTVNEVVTLGAEGLEKERQLNPNSYFGWLDAQLHFSDESLKDVLVKISRWYGVRIDNKLKEKFSKKYTSYFDNPSLLEMMDVLSFVYGFKYNYNEEKKVLVIY